MNEKPAIKNILDEHPDLKLLIHLSDFSVNTRIIHLCPNNNFVGYCTIAQFLKSIYFRFKTNEIFSFSEFLMFTFFRHYCIVSENEILLLEDQKYIFDLAKEDLTAKKNFTSVPGYSINLNPEDIEKEISFVGNGIVFKVEWINKYSNAQIINFEPGDDVYEKYNIVDDSNLVINKK